MQLTEMQIKLLRRGERGQFISLTDNTTIRGVESGALRRLRDLGLVEYAKGPFPPGPPSETPYVITDAGREELWKEIGRPVPHHGSGP